MDDKIKELNFNNYDSKYQQRQQFFSKNMFNNAKEHEFRYAEHSQHHKQVHPYPNQLAMREKSAFHSDAAEQQAKDKKFSQKIYVDNLFPSHIKPASVLIGAKGMNHNKMQSSGCFVQLRGKGCSQVPSAWSEEPVHLFVSYDHEGQFERLKEILKDIVEGCTAQNSRRPTTQSTTPCRVTPPPPMNRFLVPIPNWFPGYITESQINAEVTLLWLFRVYLVKEHTARLEDVGLRLSSFFYIDSIVPHLSRTSIPPGPLQLRYFIISCPYFLNLYLPGVILGPDTSSELWAKALISLVAGTDTLLKENLRELHIKARCKQAELLALDQTSTTVYSNSNPLQQYAAPLGRGDESSTTQTTLVGAGMPSTGELKKKTLSPYGRDDIPLTSLCLLIQAIYYLIETDKGGTLVGELKDKFYQRYSLPLYPTPFGYPNVKALVKEYPRLFSVYGTGKDTFIETVPFPDFSIVKLRQPPPPSISLSSNSTLPSSESTPPNPPPQLTAAQTAPRLLGLLGKLVKS